MSDILEAGDDGELIDESTIDVTVNDGIRPPETLVSFCEGTPGVHQLTTGRYESSGRVRFAVRSRISLTPREVPDEYEITYIRVVRNGDLELVLQLE